MSDRTDVEPESEGQAADPAPASSVRLSSDGGEPQTKPPATPATRKGKRDIDVTRDTIPSPRTEALARADSPDGDRRRSRTRTRGDKRGRSEGIIDTLAAGAEPPQEGSLPQLDERNADPLIGLVVAERYRIVERIGRGGMGIVYRVEHTRIGKLLAMKLLAGELSQNKEVVRRFKQEALTVSKLSCPHTVQVFDYGQWQHLTYLVMELVDGLDLSRALRRYGPMPFARVGKIMAQVCASLTEAHQKGIVHRDIKPENIMIIADENGVESAKVLDFGLAKLRENSELNEVTLQGAVIGTPYYMSPEQVLGEDVDGRTDIYSLGAVMYRALTGNYPFNASSPMAMFTKHLTEQPPVIADNHPDLGVPKGVSDAVLRCMQKSKADRFQTIEELRDLLVQEIHALGVPSSEMLLLTERPSLVEERRGHELAVDQIATREELEAYETKLRRNKYGVWALGAALLAAAGGAAGWFFLLRPQPKFLGEEVEPNNSAAEANELPLGQAVRGSIGQRLEPNAGDRDFYRITVPGSSRRAMSLELEPLPNFGLCAALYRVGYAEALAQFCSGQMGGQAVVVPSLGLDPGSYFVAVVQDRNATAGAKGAAPIYENVSDVYRLTIAPASSDGVELEPNDTFDGAEGMEPHQELGGTLGFMGDEDVFCAPKPGGVVWTVEDGKRRFGTVLEATPFVDTTPGPMMRLHHAQAQPLGRARVDADVNGAWLSPPCVQARCCLRLRLARDPWIDPDTAAGPLPDDTKYRVKLDPAK